MLKNKDKNNNTLEVDTSKKIKKKKHKNNFASWFAGFLFAFIVCCIAAGVVGFKILDGMLENKPTINVGDFQNSESSKIYDRNGEVIAELGVTIRENISYDDMPNCLIDAFVAVEDSRFFEHNGFDLPRFVKSAIENVLSFSFAQGGSTFTMQLVKNTYFTNDAAGTMAASTINRKVQEIALAMELENLLSKEQIMELYLNKLNYGASGRAIRGIEKAALYYFGHSARECDISESALLAGVINSPYYYNPFYFLENATIRRNDVLYQMYNHGYITQAEYDETVAIKLEDQLSNSGSIGTGHESVQYQAFIDAVVNEAFELGYDPYSSTMDIYTSMDQHVQTVMDNIQKGDVEGRFVFTDDYVECASIAINSHTGEIAGILGGRNYASGGQLLLNHATDQFKQTGSTMKTILVYPLAFEYLGWATSHTVLDEPITYAGTNIVVKNSYSGFYGDATLEKAIVNSTNTVPIKTLQSIFDRVGYSTVQQYLQKLGFSCANEYDVNVQWAIGGGEWEASVEEMAAAFAAITNGGRYHTPHTITKIEFASGKTPYNATVDTVEVLSEQASYLMSRLLKRNVDIGFYYEVIRSYNYELFGKTGTSDWGSDGEAYGIPQAAIKDGWMTVASTDFSVATWYGYDKIYPEAKNYFDISVWNKRIKEHITKLVLNAVEASYGAPKRAATMPEGITSITHIKGLYPYTTPFEGLPSSYITTGQIATKDAKLVSPDYPVLYDIYKSECDVSLNNSNFTLTISWPEYPEKDKLEIAPPNREMILYGFPEDEKGEKIHQEPTGEDGEDDEKIILAKATGERFFDYSWFYGCVQYMADIEILDEDDNVVSTRTISSSSDVTSIKLNVKENQKIKVYLYYGYSGVNAQSNVVEMDSISLKDIDVTITIPDASDDMDDVIYWANKNNIKYTIVKHLPTAGHDEDTWEIYDVDGNYLSVESQYTYSNFYLVSKGIVIHHYYAGANYALSFSNQSMTIVPGNEYTIKANFEVKKWTVPDSLKIVSTTVNDGETTMIFSVPDKLTDGAVVSISASDNKYSASLGLTVDLPDDPTV